MIITAIEVEVHEKRNNPYAYGHYDTSVRLHGELSDGDLTWIATGGCMDLLIETARDKVREECDRWERQLNDDREKQDLLRILEQRLDHMERYLDRDHGPWTDGMLSELRESWQQRVKERDKLGESGDLTQAIADAMQRVGSEVELVLYRAYGPDGPDGQEEK